MKQRIITSLAIIGCALPPLLLGGVFLDILILIVTLLGCSEIMEASMKQFSWLLFTCTVVLVCTGAMVDANLLLAILVLLVLMYMSLPVFSEKFHVKDCSVTFLVSTLFMLTIRSIYLLYAMDMSLMLVVVVATYATDTGAYFTGRSIGKHKLNKRISPHKTIEGSVGGYILGVILGAVMGVLLVPVHLRVYAYVMAVVCPLIGQLGDLAFSAIKRNFNVKDFGSIFPGHGGVLDRVDSLLFNLVIAYSLIQVTAIFL